MAGHSSLESFLVGDKTWNELTEKQQTRRFCQATAVLTFLQLVNKFRYKSNRKQMLLLPEIRQLACTMCPFPVNPRRLAKWHVDFIQNGHKFSESLQGKWEREWLLDQHDLKLKAVEFLNGFDD